jgi:hypothetical protein
MQIVIAKFGNLQVNIHVNNTNTEYAFHNKLLTQKTKFYNPFKVPWS